MNSLFVLLVASATAQADLPELLQKASDAELAQADRMQAFEELVEQGYGDTLIAMADDQDLDARQRWVAIRALGRINSPPAVEALVRLLGDEVSGMRAAAAAALADARQKEHAEKVAGLLEDPAVIVRGAAADALAQLQEPRTVPYLERALDDPSNFYRGESLWVRRHYVVALGSIGDKASLPSLIRCLHDADSDVVDATLAALEAVTGRSWADGRSHSEQVAAWTRWYANQ